jgi:L-ribulose-5-phosphate 3-epimerase
MITRRSLLLAGAALPLFARKPAGLELGVMDGVVGQSGNPRAAGIARQMGLKGVQVTLGQPKPDRPEMPLENKALQAAWRDAAAENEITLDATYIDVLHASCLKNDKQSPDWVARGIDITANLKAPILMTVFFGKCSVVNTSERDYVADVFKDLSREAERRRVILGFENLLNAEDNLAVFNRVNSPAFKIYYDVGNSTNTVNVDAAREIRALGRERICQFHFKDKGYLGEGKVNFPEILKAIDEIGFRGYANLETGAPSGNMAADLKRNIAYLQELMG